MLIANYQAHNVCTEYRKTNLRKAYKNSGTIIKFQPVKNMLYTDCIFVL